MTDGRRRLVLKGAPGSPGGLAECPGLEGLEMAKAPLLGFAPAESPTLAVCPVLRTAASGRAGPTSLGLAAAMSSFLPGKC